MEPRTPIVVFFLVPDLGPCGEIAAARVLATGLPRDRFRATVGVLGPVPGAAAGELRDAGVAVLSLPVRHALDLNGARRLRNAVRESGATIVHAWGAGATRLSRLIVTHDREGRNVPYFLASASASTGGGLRGWLTARQLRRADRVVPATRADGERYRRHGVRGDHLTLISPAAPAIAPLTDRAALFTGLNVPDAARLIVTGGRSERGIGPRDAIVAFDMLRYDARDLHLAVFGAGSGATALEQFGRALAFDDFRVRLAACVPTRALAVQAATAVWVTDPRGGAEEALQAMAAGKPVIGWNTAELSEIVDDGVTGFLVPVGDRAALATKARLLLDDPALASRLGEAGRTRAAERFSAPRLIEQYARLYAELS